MSDKNKNVSSLPCANTDVAAADLEQIKRNLPILIAHAGLVAQLRIASYRAHLSEGFTEVQALELCKSLSF